MYRIIVCRLKPPIRLFFFPSPHKPQTHQRDRGRPLWLSFEKNLCLFLQVEGPCLKFLQWQGITRRFCLLLSRALAKVYHKGATWFEIRTKCKQKCIGCLCFPFWCIFIKMAKFLEHNLFVFFQIFSSWCNIQCKMECFIVWFLTPDACALVGDVVLQFGPEARLSSSAPHTPIVH